MKAHRVQIAVVATVLCLLAGGVYWSAPSDPPFEGQPFSWYLARFSDGGLSAGGVVKRSGAPMEVQLPSIAVASFDTNAYRAIHSVGTNALRMLVDRLDRRDFPPKRLAWEFSERHPWIRKYWHLWTLAAYGREARSALPLLTNLDTASRVEPNRLREAVAEAVARIEANADPSGLGR